MLRPRRGAVRAVPANGSPSAGERSRSRWNGANLPGAIRWLANPARRPRMPKPELARPSRGAEPEG